MRDCTFRAVTWGVYGYCYVHMVTGCVHYGYGDGSVSACRSARTLCPLVCDTAYTRSRRRWLEAALSRRSGPRPRPPGTTIKNVTNKNGPLSTFVSVRPRTGLDRHRHRVLSARRGMTRSRRWELLLVMLLAAVGGSRPARATAVAAGRKRSGPLNVFIMRIQPPMNHKTMCDHECVRRRDMRGTGLVGSRPDPSRD